MTSFLRSNEQTQHLLQEYAGSHNSRPHAPTEKSISKCSCISCLYDSISSFPPSTPSEYRVIGRTYWHLGRKSKDLNRPANTIWGFSLIRNSTKAREPPGFLIFLRDGRDFPFIFYFQQNHPQPMLMKSTISIGIRFQWIETDSRASQIHFVSHINWLRNRISRF